MSSLLLLTMKSLPPLSPAEQALMDLVWQERTAHFRARAIAGLRHSLLLALILG